MSRPILSLDKHKIANGTFPEQKSQSGLHFGGDPRGKKKLQHTTLANLNCSKRTGPGGGRLGRRIMQRTQADQRPSQLPAQDREVNGKCSADARSRYCASVRASHGAATY